MLRQLQESGKMWQQINRTERRQLAIVLMLGALYGCVLSAQFYVPRLVNTMGGSATIAGLLLMLSILPVFGTALFGNRISRRWTPPQMLRIGLACHAIQMLLMGSASSLVSLVPSMIFGGIGYGFTFVTLLSSATALTPKAHYAQGISYLSLSTQMGIGLGSLLTALTEPALGTQGIFWAPMGLAILGMACANRLPEQITTQPEVPNKPKISSRGNLLEMFILMGILGLAFGLPLQFVPMWLGKSTTMTFSPAYFLTTSFFTIMLTRLLFSHWLTGSREFRVVPVCFAVVALAIAILGQAHTPLQFAACAVAYGAAYSLLYPSCTAYLLKQVDSSARGGWSNWVLLGYEIGARCLPAVFGLVADWGGFPLTFRLLAALIAGVAVWHVLKRQQQRKIQATQLMTSESSS